MSVHTYAHKPKSGNLPQKPKNNKKVKFLWKKSFYQGITFVLPTAAL
jgi:hypothetical protein